MPEGITRYNGFVAIVTNDRINHLRYMVKFKEAQQLAIGTKTRKREQDNIKAVHSLWVEDNNSTHKVG
jgi:hypothetical protein